MSEYCPIEPRSSEEVARLLDHTLLKPDVTRSRVEQECRVARQYGFAAFIVNPIHIDLCARMLEGSQVAVGVPISFPLGATAPEFKVYQAERAIKDGATELDMVVNIGAVKEEAYDVVQREMTLLTRLCHSHQFLFKVVLETGYLTDQETIIVCKLARSVGVDFVKTSTGLGPSGATTADVALMRETVGAGVGVKAAGGIRDLAEVKAMLAAGASRIGTSASAAIVEQARVILPS